MADYTYITPYTYNGVQYKRGDALVVSGNYYYTINSTSASGSVSNATKYFYGYCQMSDGSTVAHPLGLMNSASHSSVTFAQMDMSAIQSGGTAMQYTITINMNGGTATNNFTSMTVVVGTNSWYAFGGYQPTRTGYTFTGLWTKASGGEQIYFADGLACGDGTYWEAYQVGDGTIGYRWKYAGNVTLYAQWSVKSYTLTINPNGGTWNSTTSNSTVTKAYGSTYTVANPTRSGYRFTGWTKSGSGSISGTTFTYGAGNCTLTANWVAVYYLDLNIYLNGTVQSSTSVCHADVYIGGSAVATNVADYYTQHDTGTKWEIKDFVVGSGYTRYSTGTTSGTLTAKTSCNVYIGTNYTITYNANGGSGATTQTVNYGTAWTTKGAVCSKTGHTQTSWNTKADGTGTTYSLSTKQTSTQSANLTLYAIYTKNTYTNSIAHWAWGFNGEGTNSTGKAYRIGSTTFNGTYGTSYTMNASRGVTVPNGYSLNSWGSSYPTGSWATYDMGESFTQSTSAFSCDYNYEPITYTITYNLDGGTNHEDNPSSYNVLYGVELQSPSKEGYKFAGWYNGNTLVTGINVGCNATFSSADDLYSQLSTRTTGNITLTATWTALSADERKIIIYDTGVVEAAMFVESSERIGFFNTGAVYATKFIEGFDGFKLLNDGTLYCEEIVERT